MSSNKLLYLYKIQYNQLLNHSKIINNYRYVPNTLVRSMHRKSIYKTEEAKKIRFYLVHKYVEYLKNYDKFLEKQFPSAMQIYQTFTVGVREFIRDAKHYFRIVRLLNQPGNNLSKLNRKEIELYHQIPKDMRKIAPILLFSTLPLANYVIFPLMYWFPKYLLTSHFWNLQQKSDFSTQLLRNRLLHNKPVFRYLQLQLNFLKPHPLFQPWAQVLGTLGSGCQPSVDEILRCKSLFMEEPYHLLYLSSNHIRHLIKLHDIHIGWFRRTRLADRAKVLIEMDRAIMREGGVHNLPVEALRHACYIRGLNPVNMKNEDMISWLNKWIKISSQIDKHTASLLLHVPILLGYNEPSNWILIYPPK